MAKRARQAHSAARLEPTQLRVVAQLFSVLSEESRLGILQILKEGPLCVGDLVEKSGLKQANVSKQLGILMRAGLVARTQDGTRAIYSIEMPMVFDLCGVVCTSMAEDALRRAKALAKK